MSRRFANLSERLSADLPQDPNRPIEDDEDETIAAPEGGAKPTSKKKDREMTEEEINAMKAEAKAEGFKEANARMNEVFASEHYAGRETLAHALLSKNMTAADICESLAAAPKIEPSAIGAETVEAAAEEAARKDMKKAIAETGNSGLDASGGGAPKKSDKDALSVWDRPIANVFHTRAK